MRSLKISPACRCLNGFGEEHLNIPLPPVRTARVIDHLRKRPRSAGRFRPSAKSTSWALCVLYSYHVVQASCTLFVLSDHPESIITLLSTMEDEEEEILLAQSAIFETVLRTALLIDEDGEQLDTGILRDGG
jgi:hypothetical protein